MVITHWLLTVRPWEGKGVGLGGTATSIHLLLAQGCGVPPLPSVFHSTLLTDGLSGPTQAQVLHFLRHAVTFQQAFQCAL